MKIALKLTLLQCYGGRVKVKGAKLRVKYKMVEVVIYVQFVAVQKHQAREQIFHGPVLLLHSCWELNLGHLRDWQQFYRLSY